MSLSRGTLYVIQLILVIVAGGFIGEFYRSLNSSKVISPQKFIANLLAGGFLSFIIAYMYYYTVGGKQISLLLGGLISYQNEKTVSDLILNIIKKYLKQLSDKNTRSD